MGSLYYKNIYNKESSEKQNEIRKSVIPYEKYVETAKNLISKQEEIRVKWREIGGEKVQLKLIDKKKLFLIEEWKKIRIKNKENFYSFLVTEGNIEKLYSHICDEGKIVLVELETKIEVIKTDIKIEEEYLLIKESSFPKNVVNMLEKMKNIEEITIKGEFRDCKVKVEYEIIGINSKEKKKYHKLYQEGELLNFKEEDGYLYVQNLNIHKSIFDSKRNEIDFETEEELDSSLENLKKVKIREKNYILSEKIPVLGNNFEVREEFPMEIIKDLRYEEEGVFTYKEQITKEELIFRVEDADVIKEKKLSYGELTFVLEKLAIDKEDINRIQIYEDELKEDEFIKKSPLEYFFEDGVEIKDEKNRSYEILRKSANYKENTFILKQKNKKNEGVLPANGLLSLKRNTYQLNMQRRALNTLIETPLDEHKAILNLFFPLKKDSWKDFKVERLSEKNWQVLTDSNREGSKEQRSFVEKALSTDDFLLLEGPPGSGKTTAILELIVQLAERGKKILLCGSTHVAIDNVLERLKERNLLDKILPVRIGDKNRISESIKEFQIDEINYIQKNPEYKDLYLESSNLVCGTTLGILQNPLFKNKQQELKNRIKNHNGKKGKSLGSIEPIYDYLIIDESSKTTFSEFLVPALYSKKWILVGDVKQLSPYTDREEVEGNVQELLPQEKREALFLLNRFCNRKKSEELGYKFLIPLSKKEMKELKIELFSKDKKINKKKEYLIISSSPNYVKNEEKISNNITEKGVSYLKEFGVYLDYHYDGIFIDDIALKKASKYIPESFIMNRIKSKDHEIFYRQGAKIKELKENLKLSKKEDKYLKERNWSTEIAWRIIREFELKNTEKQGEYLTKQIENLLPVDKKKIKMELFNLKTVALPSILESVQRGIGRSEDFHNKTALTEGFENIKSSNLKNRVEKFTYQHRMHKEISKNPRNLFYENNSLRDSKTIDRSWDFKRYPSRNIWIDHNIHQNGNQNKEEVKLIEKELEAIFKWKSKDEKSKETLEIGILSFYKGQEKALRGMLQKYCNQPRKVSQFTKSLGKKEILDIKLYTVDKFQGQEADIIFLSMVNTHKIGFLDNPNRLNVAITRAKYQMIYVGKRSFYLGKDNNNSSKMMSKDLREIAEETCVFKEKRRKK